MHHLLCIRAPTSKRTHVVSVQRRFLQSMPIENRSQRLTPLGASPRVFSSGCRVVHVFERTQFEILPSQSTDPVSEIASSSQLPQVRKRRCPGLQLMIIICEVRRCFLNSQIKYCMSFLKRPALTPQVSCDDSDGTTWIVFGGQIPIL